MNPCLICDRRVRKYGVATILGKYPVSYFRCDHCGFIQSEPPFWLEEAYAEAITRSDIGMLHRNLRLANPVEGILLAFCNPAARFVDYGGGYGLFVRLMRDRGFDFYRHDPVCENIFARGFDADLTSRGAYELLTAFEVVEHLPNPRETIAQMLELSRNLLIRTHLVPSPPPGLNEWWYYGLEHGQHVALYSRAALEHLAEYFNLRLVSDGRTLHLLSEKAVPEWFFRVIRWSAQLSPWIIRVLTGKWHRRSRLADDYARLTGQRLT